MRVTGWRPGGGMATEKRRRLGTAWWTGTPLYTQPCDRQGQQAQGLPLSSGLETVSRFFQPLGDYGEITSPCSACRKEALIRSSKGHSLISHSPAFCSRPTTWLPQRRRCNTRLAHRAQAAACSAGCGAPGDWGPVPLLSLAVWRQARVT